MWWWCWGTGKYTVGLLYIAYHGILQVYRHRLERTLLDEKHNLLAESVISTGMAEVT